MINWWNTIPTKSDQKSVGDAVANRALSEGIVSGRVEAKIATLMGAKHCVLTPSGSAALALSLMALGVKSGDSVGVPATTWVATASAVTILGAKPILIDVESDRPVIGPTSLRNIDPTSLAALIVVHLNGIPVKIDEIRQLSGWKSIPIVEDSCQAFGSSYYDRCLGSIGDLGCFSFGVTKLLTSGQGGAVITSSDTLNNALRLAKNNGVIDIVNPEYLSTGFNFKYSDILASFLESQLNQFWPKVEHLKRVYQIYYEKLDFEFFELLDIPINSGSIPLYAQARFKRGSRATLIEVAANYGIDLRPYPPSLVCSPKIESEKKDFPNSIYFSEGFFYLPSGYQDLVKVEKLCSDINQIARKTTDEVL